MEDFYFEDETPQADSNVDLKRYWRTILHKWWLWTIVTLAISIPWILYVKNEQPVYEAQAVIQFQSYEGMD
ncbi:MAG: hypothetical protein D6814_00470, partial [Calditrichaeota bacterium]